MARPFAIPESVGAARIRPLSDSQSKSPAKGGQSAGRTSAWPGSLTIFPKRVRAYAASAQVFQGRLGDRFTLSGLVNRARIWADGGIALFRKREGESRVVLISTWRA